MANVTHWNNLNDYLKSLDSLEEIRKEIDLSDFVVVAYLFPIDNNDFQLHIHIYDYSYQSGSLFSVDIIDMGNDGGINIPLKKLSSYGYRIDCSNSLSVDVFDEEIMRGECEEWGDDYVWLNPANCSTTEEEGFVYFYYSPSLKIVKIGKGIDPTKRRKYCLSQVPVNDLILLGYIKGYTDKEKFIHKLFGSKRCSHLEWFYFDDMINDWMRNNKHLFVVNNMDGVIDV